MSAIVLKARVKLFPEKLLGYAEGVIPEDKAIWVWRRIGVEADEIFRVIAYKHNKTLIKDVWGDTILIGETFEEVFKKWSANKTEDLNLSESSDDEESIDDDEDD